MQKFSYLGTFGMEFEEANVTFPVKLKFLNWGPKVSCFGIFGQ